MVELEDLMTQLKNLQKKKPLDLNSVESTLKELLSKTLTEIEKLQNATNPSKEIREGIIKELGVVTHTIEWSLPSLKENENPWFGDEKLGKDFNAVVLERLIGVLAFNFRQHKNAKNVVEAD